MKLFGQIFVLVAFGATTVSAQSYFNVEKEYPCSSCGPYTQDLTELKPYTWEQVQEVHKGILKEGLEFGYPQGGCQQRAEMMHQLIERKFKMDHARIWIFAPVDLIEGETTLLEIDDLSGVNSDNKIRWGYHVAPCFIVEQNHKRDTVVLDPSLGKTEIMKISDWFLKMTNSNVSKYTFLRPHWYFFNTQKDGSSKVINGYFYDYSPSNGPNVVTQYDKLTMEREIAANDVAIFLKRKLKSGYNDSDGAIRRLIGNVENVVSFFAAQERCNKLHNTTLRGLYAVHSKLLSEAQEYYQKRVLYWMAVSQK